MRAMSCNIILRAIVTVLEHWQLETYAKSCNTQLSVRVWPAVCVCMCLSAKKTKTVFTGKAHGSEITSNPTA